jgi:hypothetical protein
MRSSDGRGLESAAVGGDCFSLASAPLCGVLAMGLPDELSGSRVRDLCSCNMGLPDDLSGSRFISRLTLARSMLERGVEEALECCDDEALASGERRARTLLCLLSLSVCVLWPTPEGSSG